MKIKRRMSYPFSIKILIVKKVTINNLIDHIKNKEIGTEIETQFSYLFMNLSKFVTIKS